MNDTAHFLFIVGTLSTGLIAILIIRAMLPKFFLWFRKTAFPVPKILASTLAVVFLAIFVVSKDFSPNSIYNFSGTINESPYLSLYSPAAALLATSFTNSLTPAQVRAGFALTAVTNVVWDFSTPTNAFFCDLGPGVHDEAYWIPLTFNPEGTATNSRWGRAVCATPSGMVLLDDVPDRLSPSFPDLSGAVTNRILSILQTPLGLLPPAGKLWNAATTNSSHLITWENLFLGRDTNAIANLQLELFQNGDFIYRIQLEEAGDYSSVTNWLIAAQSGSAASGEGGEVFAFADDAPVTQLETDPLPLLADTITSNPVFANLTNSVSLRPQTLELRWTHFGDLADVGADVDSDNDGLSDWDELFIYHTDPSNPDTDADGLWDGEEVNQYGTSPVNSDSDNDGDLDFWQVFSPSSFTNAPWAEESEDSSLLFFTTHLENTSNPHDFAVLRIGDAMIPVLANKTLSARIAIPKGGEAAFILLPGPGLSESATAMLWVTASVYRQTLGLEVTPQTLTSNSCFTVSGIKPSSDYGADVFTYKIGSWYNRGRYTVLGLKNRLAYTGKSVDMAHAAVGVTNDLVFWTGVKLPTGELNLSLLGDGKADLVVSNRITHVFDVLLSSTVTNYTADIVAWRDVYCDPDTLYVQARLIPKANGFLTLTQSFEGSGNELSVRHSVSQLICIHTFIAEPITSETDPDGYVYNPSGIPVGGTAKFKVSLDPMTGFTEDDIEWAGSNLTFVNGDNKGIEVTVQGNGVDSFVLLPSVNGLRLSPFPLFHGNVMMPTTAPVTVWIVRDNYGQNAPITQAEIQPLIDDANKILRQKALTLFWNGTANYTNRYEWQDITDALNPTNALLNALMNCTNNTGGLEIYFVKTLKDGGEDLGGLNGNAGLVLAQGNEYGSRSSIVRSRSGFAIGQGLWSPLHG